MKSEHNATRIAGQAAHTDRVYGRGNREQAAWIFYQMRLHNMTQRSVAATAGVSDTMVRSVASGIRTSARVQKAIAKALNFASWAALLAAYAEEVAA
ncbi:MAG: hypothetical protein A2Y38_20170 [Spirochaetes bacterium GWB1_59_5]|nr:MAG: hypothetical protein A2Y38_20170 [Spirochaetes bacterium GWB1_59_5]